VSSSPAAKPGAEASAFRLEVREFLREKLSPQLAARSRAGYYLSKAELIGWHKTLAARGWIGGNWPVEHGGPGWTPQQRYEFEDECAKAGAPILITVGINQVAALLIRYGTPEQKARHLPAIRSGDAVWCQGFSEPQAGSDLASLRCRAERVGDEYVINGSKIWTTAAHWSDWCFLLVRTDSSGRKQEGITILLMDMKTPGVTVRPIIGIDGMHSLNETFLDDVRIPVSNRVGEEGKGWGLMKVFLGNERFSAAGIWKCRAHFERLCTIARTQVREGRPLIEHPRFRSRIAWLEIRMRALEVILLGVINDPAKATGVEASLLKLRGTEVQQELLLLMSEAAGPYAVPFHPEALSGGWSGEPIGPEFATPATAAYLFWRKGTISGGSSEIMRNLIAQNVMG
jgi:alkylation response protein AidB-like acyl-CoA dehydrogenase